MNRNPSQLKIIEEILKRAGSDEDSICHQLNLAPEDYDRYRNYLLRIGLVKADTDDGYVGILQVTSAGKALLRLIDRIDGLIGQDVEGDALDYGEEFGAWSPSRGMEETMGWRDTILQNYVLEQAEITRLETQLSTDDDDEGETELEQRYRRLSALQNLLDKMGHLAGELAEQDVVEYKKEYNTGLPSRTKAETVGLLINQLLPSYVLEQAELTRLAAQLREVDDEEGELELEQRLQRLEVLQNLLGALQRITRSHMGR